jgi:hypothetical protein
MVAYVGDHDLRRHVSSTHSNSGYEFIGDGSHAMSMDAKRVPHVPVCSRYVVVASMKDSVKPAGANSCEQKFFCSTSSEPEAEGDALSPPYLLRARPTWRYAQASIRAHSQREVPSYEIRKTPPFTRTTLPCKTRLSCPDAGSSFRVVTSTSTGSTNPTGLLWPPLVLGLHGSYRRCYVVVSTGRAPLAGAGGGRPPAPS